MTSHERGGRPLPKFGEWDVNNPASADGFTVIFAKARDEKKNTGTSAGGAHQQRQEPNTPNPQQHQQQPYHQGKKKWMCCFGSV